MKIDVHNHIGIDPAYGDSRNYDDIIDEMNNAHVDKCVIFPFTTNPDIKEQNTIIKTAFDKHEDRFIGFFTMNPKLPEMVDLMHEYKNQGFNGVVTDPCFDVMHDEKRFHEMIECAFVLDMTVLLHADDKDTIRVPIAPLESMLNKYPEVKFILSSMYYDSIGIATRHKNVYIDTAMFTTGYFVAKATKPIGTHRILIGTNTPNGLLKCEIGKIRIIDYLTDFQKSLIFGQNTKRLLKI